ncbi:MAG: sugar ABC transporter permease [Vallitalea sp.]|jgi:multiple sugar transport system permease protein|nr:sugar ABC transporter permease [Vallitalea sp.]
MLKKQKSLKKKEAITGYLFMAPFILGFLVFQFIPIVMSLVLSFINFNSLKAVKNLKFVGFSNYKKVFSDDIAIQSFIRSFRFAIVFVIIMVVASLLMALLINKQFYFRKTLRTMIYLPYVSNVIAISMAWRIILDPAKGPVNTFLKLLGVNNLPMWLDSTDMALPTIAVINIWTIMAFQTIIFLAALQGVPKLLYEAAEIDGASKIRKFISITLPMISPTTFLVVIVSIISSFKNYAIVLGLTNGGPGTASRVIALNIYEEAFMYNKYSYASTQALLLFGIILIITIIQWKGQKKWVHY